ncbi:hypothetical protein GCM10020369_35660 [Cryptosporangium minutisporangium]|uniref:Uncharacterized protein n=1 Tax=Cryptosporangium minutisporangium TaxID=113569 RepID=A0ABP6T051_9ACTN
MLIAVPQESNPGLPPAARTRRRDADGTFEQYGAVRVRYEFGGRTVPGGCASSHDIASADDTVIRQPPLLGVP